MAIFLTWLTQRQTGGDWTADYDAEAALAPRAGASALSALAPAAPQGDRQD